MDWDPWGLVDTSTGDCRSRGFAFFTICITEDAQVLAACLASICSLLVTTDPACVVALVSRWVYASAAEALRQSAVVPVIAPEWPPLPKTHRYAHLPNRSYTFAKLEAFRLTQYDLVAHFDVDVVFMRNASGLGQISSAFAAARVPKGKDPSRYVQNGVNVIRPSLRVYSELVDTWRGGKHELHFSDEELTDTDVAMELCILKGRCGPVSDLDACVYNHGSWLPIPLGRPCRTDEVVARHGFRADREVDLARDLRTALLRNTCRPRASSAEGREAQSAKCWTGHFQREDCCTPPNRWMPWGNVDCWGDGLTFERCCEGVDDAARLGGELLEVGPAWYGLSSMPDNPPSNLLGERCKRAHALHRKTFWAFSGVTTRMAGEVWPTPEMIWYGKRCEALRAPHLEDETAVFLLFHFRFGDYFAREASRSAIVSMLHKKFLTFPELSLHVDRMSACVPRLCCRLQPEGVNSTIGALHEVLWSVVVQMAFQQQVSDLPYPQTRDFEEISAIDPNNPWHRHKCYRE